MYVFMIACQTAAENRKYLQQLVETARFWKSGFYSRSLSLNCTINMHAETHSMVRNHENLCTLVGRCGCLWNRRYLLRDSQVFNDIYAPGNHRLLHSIAISSTVYFCSKKERTSYGFAWIDPLGWMSVHDVFPLLQNTHSSTKTN